MIISKSPLRITLGGGGTDLPSYYKNYEGFTIGGTIDKSVYVLASEPWERKIILKYSEIENVDSVDKIKHNLFREALKYYEVDSILLTSVADIPSGTGLGSSGAFLISLLNTLHLYKRKTKPLIRELADIGCKLELDILKENEGKQDKYCSAFGGIKAYTYHKDGKVSIEHLKNEDYIQSELERNLLLFNTKVIRKGLASSSLKLQDDMGRKNNIVFINQMNEIKSIAYQSKILLENLKFDEFGELLDKHWQIKKMYAPHSTNEKIDKYYEYAKRHGALGGKMIGAPGGGFLMIYHPGNEKEKWDFIRHMDIIGLNKFDYKFTNNGVETL